MRDTSASGKPVLCLLNSMRRVVIVFMILGFFNEEASAQHFLYSTRNYTAVDGLPQSQVMALVEDANGYLWAGTMGGGLARFDGREFKVYTTKDGLLSNDIAGLILDQHQNLWIHHTRGLTKFDGSTFKRFEDTRSLPASKRFRRVFENGDSVFLITANGGLAKIHQDSVYYWDKPVQRDRRIMRYHKSLAGTSCFFLDDGSYLVQPKGGKAFSFSPGFDPGKLYFVFDYKQDILFRTEKGLFKLDEKNKSVTKLPWQIDHYVLAYDEKNDFFWTSGGDKLLKESFGDDGKLKGDTVIRDVSISQVLNDSEGNTWLASSGRGLFRYFIQDFNRCSSEELQGVMAILADSKGNNWIGTFSKGLWKIKKGKVSSYVDAEENYRNVITTIKEAPDGKIWVGSGAGLGRYNPTADKFEWFGRQEGLPGWYVHSLDFDEKGGIWIGTGNGLSYFDGKSFRNYSAADGLLVNMVWHTHYSEKYKTLFIGNDFGLQTWKNGTIDYISIPGLNNTNIISINDFRDSLLSISTGGAGVMIFNPTNRQNRFITSDEGLASDFIYFAVPDEKQNLWIGTEKGINRVKLDSKLEIVENLYYGYDNGLTGVETNANAFLINGKDKYFGLIDGLYEFNDLSDQSRTSFGVHLTGIKLFYGEYSPYEFSKSAEGFFKLPTEMELPPDKNHITFLFNRVDKRYPKSVKFKYYLEGFDKKWSQQSSTSFATYSNLPPGDYVFRVMSTDNKGSWDERMIAYPFTIKTPFYQTASFIVGALILAAGLITLILYLRVKQRVNKVVMLERIRVKEQETLRKEIARDFHDEMGNQLTRIINYISLLRLNQGSESNGHHHHGNGSMNGSSDLYTKVEDSAKYLYSGTRDFIWSIDPVNDELSKLFIHIRDFGEKLFEEKGIQFRAFNEVKDKVKLPYGFSREANLIFKEAMTNAFKYSQAQNVTLSLNRTENDHFEMSFGDDGIGFSTGEIEKSNGLQNIRERADRINSVLRINSVKQQGVSITLTFKLTKTLKYGLAL